MTTQTKRDAIARPTHQTPKLPRSSPRYQAVSVTRHTTAPEPNAPLKEEWCVSQRREADTAVVSCFRHKDLMSSSASNVGLCQKRSLVWCQMEGANVGFLEG